MLAGLSRTQPLLQDAIMAETDKSSSEKKSGATATAAKNGQAKDAIGLLKADHRMVEGLFADFEKARTATQKARITVQIASELKVHAAVEEKLFYPALRAQAEDEADLDEAQVEHDTLKILIADLEAGDAEQPFFDAKVKVLQEYVQHHVKEEESPGGLFAQAKKAEIDLAALGEEIAQLKIRLQKDPDQIDITPVSISLEGDGAADRASGRNGWYGDPQGHSDAARR